MPVSWAILARPERQLETALQVKEGDGAVFEFGADNPSGREAQSVTIETDGGCQVVDAQGDDAEGGFMG